MELKVTLWSCLVFVMIALSAPGARAQENTFWIMEGVVRPHSELRYHLGLLGQRQFEDQPAARDEISEHFAEAQCSIHENFTAIAKFRSKSFGTNSVMPSATAPNVAQPLNDLQTGVVFRRVVAGNNQFGAGAFVGSAGDSLYRGDTMVYDNLLFYSWGLSASQFIAGMLSVSNHRAVLPGLPLPGFAARLTLGDGHGLIVGVPFSKVWISPSESTRLQAEADFFNYSYRGRASYFLFSGLEFYGEASETVEVFMRHGRVEHDDHIYYGGKEWVAGMGIRFFDTFMIDGVFGVGYKRYIAEAMSYKDRLLNARYFDNGTLARVRLRLVF